MDTLSELVKQRLNAHNLAAPARSAEILYTANQLLSQAFPEMPKAVKAYRLENGILYVRTENSVLAQELWGIQEKLMGTLRSSFGEKAVLKIIPKWFDISEWVE
jgi:hypothetical protein